MGQLATVTVPPADHVPPELLRLLVTAMQELQEHRPGDSEEQCVVCHTPWPCEPACLAAFTLEAI